MQSSSLLFDEICILKIDIKHDELNLSAIETNLRAL